MFKNQFLPEGGINMKRVILLGLLISCLVLGNAQKPITPDQAANYMGKKMTVCGKVVGTKYLYKSKGQPTLLNLDKPYPNQIFTVLIWGSDRDKFIPAPETLYDKKNICVTGVIKDYKGKPEIIVNDQEQIKIK